MPLSFRDTRSSKIWKDVHEINPNLGLEIYPLNLTLDHIKLLILKDIKEAIC